MGLALLHQRSSRSPPRLIYGSTTVQLALNSNEDSRPLWVVAHGSAELYGSDKVLLSSMTALRDDPAFRPVVVLHEDGPLRNALRDAGVEVHTGSVTKIRRALVSPGGVLGLPAQFAATARILDHVVAERPVSLVYSNTLAVLGAAVWARRRRLPHLWHVHEILQRPALVRRMLPWFASKLSDRVLANSLQTQLWLEAEVPSLRGRVSVAFNGLDSAPQSSPEAVAAFRASVGAADGDVVATLVGRFNHMKGQPLLVRALALLKESERARHLRVALVGDVYAGHADFRAQCEELIQSLGLQHRVVTLPFQEDVGPVWQGTDIAVVASTEPESFGMVAIEAMASGLPVIAAAHGGLLDIIEDDVTGLLVPPNDAQALAQALSRLLEDPALRARLGAAGAQRQKRCFSLAAHVSHTREAGIAAMSS